MNFKQVIGILAAVSVGLALGCGKDKGEEKNASLAAKTSTSLPPLPPLDGLDGDLGQNEPIPEVVARVDGEPITKKEFQRQLDYAFKAIQARGLPPALPDKDRARLLDAIVDEKILYLLAQQQDISISDEELQADIDKQKGTLGYEEQFNQWLAKEGLTLDDFRTLRKEQLIKTRFTDALTEGITVTEEEIKAEYERLKAMGQMSRNSETVDVAHILTNTQEEAEAARERVLAGEDFGEVAKEVSKDPGSAKKGGLYRETARNSMVPEFEEKMFGTPIGDVTEPFETDFGWHILTVKAKHAPGVKEYESVKEDLGDLLKLRKKRDILLEAARKARADMDVEILYLSSFFPIASNAPGGPAPPPEEPSAQATAPASAPEEPAPAAAAASAPAETVPAEAAVSAQTSETPAEVFGDAQN